MAEQDIKSIFFLSARMLQRGVSKYTLHLAKELVRRGYLVSVACGPGALDRSFEEAQIDIVKYRDIDKRFRPPFLVGKVLSQLRQFAPDILHVQSSEMVSLGACLASAAHIPMVVTVHHLMLRGWAMWRLGMKASRVIAVSEAVREDLVNVGRVPKEKIEVIPNGLDLDDYTVSRPMGGGVPVVGVVGPLEKIKGVRYFVEAAKLILDNMRGVQFLIAGNGGEEQNLRRQVRAMGLTKNVIFATDIRNHLAVIRTLDILVLPSLQEGLGFTVLEAMAVGKPVVASAVGGVYSLVIDGETGFLVDKGDSKAIAEKVLQLLRDPKLAVAMGAQARTLVEKEFDIWTVADRTIEVYKQATNAALV